MICRCCSAYSDVYARALEISEAVQKLEDRIHMEELLIETPDEKLERELREQHEQENKKAELNERKVLGC